MLNSTIQNGFIMSFLKHIVQCTVGGGGGGWDLKIHWE
jgi:hypothetical protein